MSFGIDASDNQTEGTISEFFTYGGKKMPPGHECDFDHNQKIIMKFDDGILYPTNCVKCGRKPILNLMQGKYRYMCDVHGGPDYGIPDSGIFSQDVLNFAAEIWNKWNINREAIKRQVNTANIKSRIQSIINDIDRSKRRSLNMRLTKAFLLMALQALKRKARGSVEK